MRIKCNEPTLRSAMMFQTVDDVRFYLNGVGFKTTGECVATNGHIAFMGYHDTDDLEKDIIIKVNGKLPSKFWYAEFIIDEGFDRVEFTGALFKKVGVLPVSVIDGKFPDVIGRFAEFNPSAYQSVFVNCEYMAIANKMVELYNPKSKIMKIQQSETQHRVQIETPDLHHFNDLTNAPKTAKAVIMQMSPFNE